MSNHSGKDSKIEKPRTAVITPEKTEEQKPKIPAEIKRIKEEEKAVKEGTKKETAELERERLEREVVGADEETARMILSIDINKESTEQAEALSRLELVNYTMLSKLFAAGFKKEVLRVFESLRSIQVEESVGLNGTEKIALKKLREITGHQDSTLFKELKNKWQSLTDKAYDIYEKSSEAKSYLTTPKSAESKKEEPWLVKTMKEHPYGTAAAVAITLAVGAYGIYEIFFADDEKDESGKTKPSLLERMGMGGWKGKMSVGALGTLALGGLIGHEQIAGAIEQVTGIAKDKIDKALPLFKDGKYIDAAKELIVGGTTAGEVVEKGVEKGKEAFNWLDEKVNFSKVKDDATKFCTEHNISAPDWLKNIKLSEIAQDLGIDKNNEKTWIEYAAIGGGALLLYKWIGKKGLALNAGIYLFIVREGKDSFGGKLISKLTKEIDEAKSGILNKVKDIPGAEFLISDALEGFSVENGMNDLLEWMKTHPAEGMIAMNGLWICRGLLYKTIKTLLKTGGNIALYAVNNPGKTAIVAGAATAIYAGRRTYIKDLVEALYEDPTGKSAKATLAEVDSLMGVDRTKSETLVEHQMPKFIDSLKEDPANALKKAETIIAYKEGKFALAWDSLGMAWYLGKATSIPVQLSGLSWEAFKSLSHIYSPEYEGNIFTSTAVAGTEMYVFASMAYEGFMTYRSILKGSNSTGRAIWDTFKLLIPGTKEWLFVAKSSCLGIPGVTPALRALDSIGITRVQGEISKILELAAGNPPNFAEIRKITDGLRTDHVLLHDPRIIKETLSGTRYGLETSAKLADISKTIEDINKAAKLGEEGVSVANKLKEIKALGEMTHRELGIVKEGTQGMLKTLRLITGGKISEAMKVGSEMLKATGVGTKIAEGTGTIATKTAKTLGELKDSLKIGERAAVTWGEVSKFGLKVAKLSEAAMPVVRFGGRVFIVVDLALSAYDVYDQSEKLNQMLASEKINILQIPDAITGIVGHVESMGQNERGKIKDTANEVMATNELNNKLAGARNFATDLKTKTQYYGISGKSEDITKRGIWDKVENTVGGILGYTQTGWAMDVIYGSADSAMRKAEQATLKSEYEEAGRIVEDLKKVQPANKELLATIRSLELAIELAKKTIEEDEAPKPDKIKIVDEAITRAREARIETNMSDTRLVA
jgi:hypothetical protein